MKTIIGIDIGTSSCKVLAIDEKCNLLGSVTTGYPVYYPEKNWTEQNPADWWEGVVEGIRQLLPELDKSTIACVGLSGQMHGMVALDENYDVVRPAILWNDQRTQTQCEEILNAAGGIDGLVKYTNNPMLTGFTAGKILWMKENEPSNYAKTKYIINPKDYIAFLLTGNIATDLSDASGTGLFDVKNRCWSDELISLVGLNRSMFAKPYPSSAITGKITEEVSRLTGLPAGTPVSAGGGDAVLSTISMGAGDRKSVAVMVGTSGVISAHSEAFFENRGGKVQFSCACVKDMYHIMGVTLAAAGSYKWFCSGFGDGDYKSMDRLAASAQPGSDGVIFLPYLFGERCPVNDADASACFVGVKVTAAKADFTRAVLEGIAFSLRQVYELIAGSGSFSRLIIAGGGAKSPLWRQIFADVFNMDVVTVSGASEGSGFGAAVVAGIGTGIFEDVNSATSQLKINTITTPNRENIGIYDRQYKKYCGLYDRLKGI